MSNAWFLSLEVNVCSSHARDLSTIKFPELLPSGEMVARARAEFELCFQHVNL